MLDGLGQQHAVVAVARVYPQHALADGPRQRDLVGIPAGDDGRIAAHRNRLQRDDIAAVAGVDRQAAGQAAVDQRDLIRVLPVVMRVSPPTVTVSSLTTLPPSPASIVRPPVRPLLTSVI